MKDLSIPQLYNTHYTKCNVEFVCYHCFTQLPGALLCKLGELFLQLPNYFHASSKLLESASDVSSHS